MGPGRRRGRVAGSVLLVLVLLAGAAAGGWWAARATLEPSAQAQEETAPEVVWASVTESGVGRSLPLSTTLRQPARVVAVNGLAGVVTAVSPGEVDVGDTVYAVAGVPVRVVEGEVPFYRDLARDAEGIDVEQLQTALAGLGFLDEEPDGEFGESTEAALKEWQDELGIPTSGTVALGELVAVDALPTTVQLGEGIARGRVLGGGEDAVLAPTGEQLFVLVVTQDQARLIPADATVAITWEDQTWQAVVGGSTQDEFGNTELDLVAPDGGPVCGEACGTLPGDAVVTLRSEVVVVPRVEGPAVPAAAVRSRADGTAYVVTESDEVAVEVLGSGGGVAIVEGVEVGTQVQVLGGDPGSVPAPAPDLEPGDGATGTGG